MPSAGFFRGRGVRSGGGGHDARKVGGKMFACIGAIMPGVSVKTDSIETVQMLIDAGVGVKAAYFHPVVGEPALGHTQRRLWLAILQLETGVFAIAGTFVKTARAVRSSWSPGKLPQANLQPLKRSRRIRFTGARNRSTQRVTQPSRSSAFGPIDNYPCGTLLHC
jgi:hypothetical protein